MPSFLVIVFFLQLAIHIINTVGAATITELLWTLYSRLPTPTSKAAREVIALRNELIQIKREMSSFSAQDEFARWAKLDRQHGKVKTAYDKKTAALSASKSRFDSTVSTLRWLSTTGLRFFLQFWFGSRPMFWLPRGSMPYYVEWILSFPKAPIGSVSIQVWFMACGSAITLVSEAIGGARTLLSASAPVAQGDISKEKPQAFPAQTKNNMKKEL